MTSVYIATVRVFCVYQVRSGFILAFEKQNVYISTRNTQAKPWFLK